MWNKRAFIISLSMTALMVITAGLAVAGDVVMAKDAVKYLDKSTYTSAQIKQYYRSLKGKTVKGSGVVVDVRTARKGSRVAVYIPGTKKPAKGYNIVVVTEQDGMDLKKGSKVSFEGTFLRYAMFTADNLDIQGTYKKR